MNEVLQDKKMLFWVLLSIFLGMSFISYGKSLLLHESNQEFAIRRIGWTITIIILFFLYMTEQEISSAETRRLINNILIFAGTFSYLYCLAFLANEKKPID